MNWFRCFPGMCSFVIPIYLCFVVVVGLLDLSERGMVLIVLGMASSIVSVLVIMALIRSVSCLVWAC